MRVNDTLEPVRPQAWQDRLFALVFSLLALVLGVILVYFPWSDFWNWNYLLTRAPALRPLWLNPYVRGAVSGLGMVNLYIALTELARLRR